jgi:hypothetical protein
MWNTFYQKACYSQAHTFISTLNITGGITKEWQHGAILPQQERMKLCIFSGWER